MGNYGYHWTPCKGGGGSGGGGWAAAVVLGCAVVVAAAWRAILTGLEVAAAVVGCAVGLGVAYGAVRLAVRVWRARARDAARAAPRAVAAPPLMLEAPKTAPAWDNGAPVTEGGRVAVQGCAGDADDVDAVQRVQVRGGAPGPAGA